MLVVLLIFFWCSLNYDVPFKITNKLKVNNYNFKFNNNFKSHITGERTPKKVKRMPNIFLFHIVENKFTLRAHLIMGPRAEELPHKNIN